MFILVNSCYCVARKPSDGIEFLVVLAFWMVVLIIALKLMFWITSRKEK